jgi:hypothetical protein
MSHQRRPDCVRSAPGYANPPQDTLPGQIESFTTFITTLRAFVPFVRV